MKLARRTWTVATIATVIVGGAVAQTTSRASVGASAVQGDSGSRWPSLSADGRYVAFTSTASNLVPGDTNGVEDVFVRDLLSGTTTLASVDSSGVQGSNGSRHPAISADGRYVAFESLATNLVPGDTNSRKDIFVRDLLGGVTSLASVHTSGAQANEDCMLPVISGDGRFVAFTSLASSLVTGDTNGFVDVFVRDVQLGVTTRASVRTDGTEANGPSQGVSISADGRYVAFLSDGLGCWNTCVFLRDQEFGTTSVLVNCDNGFPPFCLEAFLSADGRRVEFAEYGIDPDMSIDIYVRDIASGATFLASPDTGDDVEGAVISGDGRYVAYPTYQGLVPGDTNGVPDIFVRDVDAGVTTRVSVSTTGVEADSGSYDPAFSADGRIIAFASGATTLVAGDTNDFADVFVRDWQQPALVPMCYGDGSGHACPCGNTGLLRRGCQNSAATGGARLTAVGTRRLSEDTFVLTSSGELPSVLSVFFQGNASVAPLNYGDGLRCIGGALKRLYVRNASGGVVSAPATADARVSARSAALGDSIPAGATRWYQVFYRDPNAAFCPNPPGNTWNSSNGIAASWGF